MSISQLLTGDNAFYNNPNYKDSTQQELSSSKPLENCIYTHSTESKIYRTTKHLFSLIVFPIALYQLIHCLAGKIIVPASTPWIIGARQDFADVIRKSFSRTITAQDEWKIKRISVQVDGVITDGAIIGKASTLANGRWVLASNGNGEFYENKLWEDPFKAILNQVNGNAIVFNYPGVGASQGMPSRDGMAKAYRGMLEFLEDKQMGIGAKEIIGYGHSIGGGVQGDALLSHKPKQGVKYVFVKSRTFSNLSTVVSMLTNRILGLFVRVLGWNMSPAESSKQLKSPEIIMQTASVLKYTDIAGKPEKIIHDGIIPAEASLAKELLNDRQPLLGNKHFMGIPEKHNHPLNSPSYLVDKINEMLKAD